MLSEPPRPLSKEISMSTSFPSGASLPFSYWHWPPANCSGIPGGNSAGSGGFFGFGLGGRIVIPTPDPSLLFQVYVGFPLLLGLISIPVEPPVTRTGPRPLDRLSLWNHSTRSRTGFWCPKRSSTDLDYSIEPSWDSPPGTRPSSSLRLRRVPSQRSPSSDRHSMGSTRRALYRRRCNRRDRYSILSC